MKSQQEINQKFQVFEQQIKGLKQQLQAVEQAISELTNLNIGLDDLVGKEGNEIMAPVGRGIYAKAKLLSEDLTVDIGNKNLVKKSIPDTKKILQEQLKKLDDVKKELEENMENINQELTNTFIEYQKQAQEQAEKKKKE